MYRGQLPLRDLEIVTFYVNEPKASELTASKTMHQFVHPAPVDPEVTGVDLQEDNLQKLRVRLLFLHHLQTLKPHRDNGV